MAFSSRLTRMNGAGIAKTSTWTTTLAINITIQTGKMLPPDALAAAIR
jgi:hypothetical protein